MPPRKSKRVAKKAKAGPPEAEDHVEVQYAVVEGPFIFQAQFLQQLTVVPKLQPSWVCQPGPNPPGAWPFSPLSVSLSPSSSDGNGCLIHQQSVLTLQDGRMQEELVAHPQSSRDGIAAVVGLMEKASEPGIYTSWHSRSLSDRF